MPYFGHGGNPPILGGCRLSQSEFRPFLVGGNVAHRHFLPEKVVRQRRPFTFFAGKRRGEGARPRFARKRGRATSPYDHFRRKSSRAALPIRFFIQKRRRAAWPIDFLAENGAGRRRPPTFPAEKGDGRRCPSTFSAKTDDRRRGPTTIFAKKTGKAARPFRMVNDGRQNNIRWTSV